VKQASREELFIAQDQVAAEPTCAEGGRETVAPKGVHIHEVLGNHPKHLNHSRRQGNLSELPAPHQTHCMGHVVYPATQAKEGTVDHPEELSRHRRVESHRPANAREVRVRIIQ
jgi:hypothetical protein